MCALDRTTPASTFALVAPCATARRGQRSECCEPSSGLRGPQNGQAGATPDAHGRLITSMTSRTFDSGSTCNQIALGWPQSLAGRKPRTSRVKSVHLRPVEDAIGESMLQITEARSVLQISKGKAVRRKAVSVIKPGISRIRSDRHYDSRLLPEHVEPKTRRSVGVRP